jgi:hypothetical protein
VTKTAKLRSPASHVTTVRRRVTFPAIAPTKIPVAVVVVAEMVVVAAVVVVEGLVVATLEQIPDVAVNPVIFREIVSIAVCVVTGVQIVGKRKRTRTNVHPTGSRE